MSILRIENIEKSYGALKVLHGVDAQVAPGAVFAIIGPNGAGKTTLFKVMTGEAGHERGRVWFDGRDVTALPAHARVRAGMGRTFQVARVFNEVPVFENVVTSVEARLRHVDGARRMWLRVTPSAEVRDEALALLDRLDLLAKRHVTADELSHGDRKRLELAITLAGRPRVLMMDEPTAGMSPSDRHGVIELIHSMTHGASVADRLTVVMTEHDMNVIFGLADRIMVLNHGQAIAEGSIDDIRANPQVREVYLGAEEAREDA